MKIKNRMKLWDSVVWNQRFKKRKIKNKKKFFFGLIQKC